MQVLDWPPDAPLVTGQAGEMEQSFRTLLAAGVKWLSSNAGAELTYGPSGFPLSEAARELHSTLMEAEPAYFGVLAGLATQHARFVQANGWEKYVETLKSQS